MTDLFNVTGDNRHPVDQLADIRRQKKVLEEREDAIKATLLRPGANLMGDEHVAYIDVRSTKRIDPARVRAILSDEDLAKVESESLSRVVTIKPRPL